MSQQDFDIATGDANTGITFRAAVNAALQALASMNSGASAPAVAYPFQIYINTTDVPAGAYIRNAANTAWVKFGYVDAGTGKLMVYNADAATNANVAPWLGITGKPATFPPDAHNQDGSTISGGTLGNTVVPLARMMRTEVRSTFANVIVLSGSTALMTLIDLGTVCAGDMILVNGIQRAVAVSSAGYGNSRIDKSTGTALVDMLGGLVSETTGWGSYVTAGIIKVLTTGTLVLGLWGGQSSGTGQFASGGMAAIVLNNG